MTVKITLPSDGEMCSGAATRNGSLARGPYPGNRMEMKIILIIDGFDDEMGGTQ